MYQTAAITTYKPKETDRFLYVVDWSIPINRSSLYYKTLKCSGHVVQVHLDV